MDSTWNASSSLLSRLSSSLILARPVTDDVVLDHHDVSNEDVYVPSAPAWMVEFVEFRQRLFLQTIEPIIVGILGPALSEEELATAATSTSSIGDVSPSSFAPHRNGILGDETAEAMHRRLGFLPDYVENAASFRDTSMSFATLITLFVTMTCILLIFLSCFYHNQKTSPLFISPRRHRLPKLVPPPLPVEGYFDWVRLDSEMRPWMDALVASALT
jgi:hypothetical protein